jgi:calcium-dependent protein kinase
MAPEVLKGKYTKQADLWSIGVIAYMLMSSQMPFYGRTRGEIVAQIMEGYVMLRSHGLIVFPPIFHRRLTFIYFFVNSKYEYKGRRWKRISKAGKAFIDDLLVVDPEDRATDDEALKASWLNRRYSATVRNPIMEEMNLAKESVLRYANYSKIRQMALMGTNNRLSIVQDISARMRSLTLVLFVHSLVIAHKSTSAEIGILRKVFQQYDTEGKGHLNYEQFKAAIADSSLQEEDYRRIFDAVVRDAISKRKDAFFCCSPPCCSNCPFAFAVVC